MTYCGGGNIGLQDFSDLQLLADSTARCGER
jgi:hypothetical protein